MFRQASVIRASTISAVPGVLGLALLASCAAPADAGCAAAPACVEPAAARCDNCPPEAVELCVEGACVAKAADAVGISATMSIARAIDQDVQSVVRLIADARGPARALTCADAFDGAALNPALNILASGYVATSGGSHHPDVFFGRVPEGDVLVLALAVDGTVGKGGVVGTGCAAVSAAAPTVTVDVLSIAAP